MKNDCALILAAGDGLRMKSSKPKVLAQVLFKPMLDWVLDKAHESGLENICVITGHQSKLIEERLPAHVRSIEQKERLGTGHAILQARAFIEKFGNGNVLILAGDAPLVDTRTITAALQLHKQAQNSATLISALLDDPKGYDRIVRGKDGRIVKVVEEDEATQDEKAIKEVSSGAYWFKAKALLIALDRLEEANISPQSTKGREIHLADTIEYLREIKMDVTAFEARLPYIVMGADDRIQLAALNEIARKAELDRHRANGVSIPIADGVIIGPGVEIGPDSLILPGTIIKETSKIGSDCVIGPNSYIENSTIGDGVTLNNTQCRDSQIGNDSTLGPFVQIRPGSKIAQGAHIGNFVEIKNSNIGRDVGISHLTYVGDSDLGEGVNLGCGTVTVNFDGKDKHRTVVEDGAFVGCNSNLIAPLTVGKNAFIAAGSTITKDVPADALAIARTRQEIKKGWVKSKKPYRLQHK